jgi:hypothetical protein
MSNDSADSHGQAIRTPAQIDRVETAAHQFAMASGLGMAKLIVNLRSNLLP